MKLMDAGVVDTDAGYAMVVAAQYGCVMPAKLLLRLEQERRNAVGGAAAAVVNPQNPVIKERALMGALTDCSPGSHRIARLLVDAGADTSQIFTVGGTEGGVLRGTHAAIAAGSLGRKSVGGKPATEKKLHRLAAIHRLLLQEEAVHATSWLWVSNAANNGIAHATTSQESAETASTPSTTAILPMNWRRHGAGVLLPGIFRWVGVLPLYRRCRQD